MRYFNEAVAESIYNIRKDEIDKTLPFIGFYKIDTEILKQLSTIFRSY